jgi:predicted signal transduction protein with EAL and GGDEF domain
MTIKTFHQGKSQASDSELFGLVGRFLVDLKMHERLGTAITTNDGDIWLVSITGKGEVRGFATARKIKTSGLHIRFVYCPDDAPLMCKAMITMAHELGLRVVAEGIETELEMTLLRDAGCDFGQGYLWGQPLRAEDFVQAYFKGVALPPNTR